MKRLLVRIRRALDIEAPADGLCTWGYGELVTTQVGGKLWREDNKWRCVKVWHHQPRGNHYALIVGSWDWHLKMEETGRSCAGDCRWEHKAAVSA